MDRFIHIFNQVKDNFAILFGIIFTFLTPIHGMILTVGMFTLIDLIFAVFVVVTKQGWGHFTSAKLFNSAPKFFFYLGSVILGFLVDTFIVTVPIWGIPLLITKIVCGFLIYLEIKSIDETSIKYGNRSLWTVLKEIINKARDIKKDISDIKKDDE